MESEGGRGREGGRGGRGGDEWQVIRWCVRGSVSVETSSVSLWARAPPSPPLPPLLSPKHADVIF